MSALKVTSYERLLLCGLLVLLAGCLCESRATGEAPKTEADTMSSSNSDLSLPDDSDNEVMTVHKEGLADLVRQILKRLLVEAQLKGLQQQHQQQIGAVSKRRMNINTMLSNPKFLDKLTTIFAETLRMPEVPVASTFQSSDSLLTELLKQLE